MCSPLQSKLLEMLAWFHEFCSSHGITYYAIGGTLLGAMRHQGFIPWDDDIDIGVPREDYLKLIDLLSQNDGRYVIETPYTSADDYFYTYAKIYDRSTTLIEEKKRDCVRGVFLDIFPLDGIGDTVKEQNDLFKKIDYLHMIFAARTCAYRKGRSLYKNMSIALARLIPTFIINEKKLAHKIDSLCAQVPYSQSKYVGNLMGSYRNKEIFSKEVFGKPVSYPFEDITIWGVEKADQYLTQIYGDWRKKPPLEKQKTTHSFSFLDLNNSYLEKVK